MTSKKGRKFLISRNVRTNATQMTVPGPYSNLEHPCCQLSPWNTTISLEITED